MEIRDKAEYGFQGAKGPNTAPHLRYTRLGIGGKKALIGNPITWTVDPLTGCLPWVTLRGGTDAESEATRDQMQDDELQGVGDFIGPQSMLGARQSPTTQSVESADGGRPASLSQPVSRRYSGPFGYISLADSTRKP